MRNMCSGVSRLEKGGGREVEVKGARVGEVEVWGGIGGAGVGRVEVGISDRDTNSPTPTVFQAADPYYTSHVSRQIVFASNRPRVKSSSRQVTRVKFVRVKLSCTQLY